MKALVVEDDRDVRGLLQQILRRRGHEVTAFEDGASAWHACQHLVFPLILLDWNLPGLDGLELCRRVRALPRGGECVILMVTGQSRPEEIATALEAGVDDYLTKPFDVKLLALRLAIAERQAAVRADRQQAEAARAWLAAVIESADDAIIGKTLDGQIVSWNPAAERLYGYPAEEVLGRSISLLIPPDRPDELAGILDRVGRGEHIKQYETVRLCQDGRRVDVSLSISPIKDAQGQIQGAATIARDISERKRTQEALELRGALLDLAQEAILIRDSDGTIRYWNHGAEELYGWSRAEALGQSLHRLLQTRFPQPSEDIDAELSRVGHWEGELVHTTRDGRQIEVATRWAVQPDDAGGARAILEINRDVTERRAVERLRDELTAVVSHELRTPLAAVLGFADLLLDREYPEDERREYLGIIVQEGQRLTTLINDFLDLQRLESGRYAISPVPLDVSSVLERAARAAGDDPAHPLRIEAPAHLPLVWADADRLQQVLSNLVSNARKYSPGGGEVHLVARALADSVEVSVRDQGLGLPPEALPRLFEKFYRVDNADRWNIKGTGLGLAICRQIVAAHGGRIWAESAGLGRGTRFAFTLPLAPPQRTQGDVLIVENDLNFARLLGAELAGQGVTAVWAASAEEAIERLDLFRPRAVLLDLLLPNLQGEDFLTRLEHIAGTALPVVVVTAKDLDFAERALLYQHGVRVILSKGPRVASRAAASLARILERPGAPRGSG